MIAIVIVIAIFIVTIIIVVIIILFVIICSSVFVLTIVVIIVINIIIVITVIIVVLIATGTDSRVGSGFAFPTLQWPCARREARPPPLLFAVLLSLLRQAEGHLSLLRRRG